jgi:predicted Zn-ribbon and HTH transcriptional regulator
MGMLHRDESEQGVYQAARDCGHCAQCCRGLKPEEPVWREVFHFYKKRRMQGGILFTIAPVCKNCHLTTFDWLLPKPCEKCQRMVVNLPRFNRVHTFCCRSCEVRYYSHRRKKAIECTLSVAGRVKSVTIPTGERKPQHNRRVVSVVEFSSRLVPTLCIARTPADKEAIEKEPKSLHSRVSPDHS